MNFQYLEELKEFIEEIGVWELYEDGFAETFKDYSLELEDSFGGEGQGENYWLVFSLNKQGEDKLYFKIPGYHISHDGSTLEVENTFQVWPKEKTITTWSHRP